MLVVDGLDFSLSLFLEAGMERRRKFFAFSMRGMLIRPVNLCWKSALGEVLFLFSAGMALTGLSCRVISASLIKVRGMTMKSRQFTKNLIYAGTSRSLRSPSTCWLLIDHFVHTKCNIADNHSQSKEGVCFQNKDSHKSTLLQS